MAVGNAADTGVGKNRKRIGPRLVDGLGSG